MLIISFLKRSWQEFDFLGRSWQEFDFLGRSWQDWGKIDLYFVKCILFHKMEFIHLKSEEDLFVLFKKYFASFYGGYIRDIYLGEEPHDLDVVMEVKYFNQLTTELASIGYTLTNEYDDLFKYQHPTKLPIDLLLDTKFDHEDTYISPFATPDVDVNDLYYFWDQGLGRYRLDRWANDFAQQFDVGDIILRLSSGDRTAYAHPEARVVRLEKIKNKGFIVTS
jgi:hypothetical protein